VRTHTFSFVWSKELTVNGKKQKWVKIRNPWGTTDWTKKKFTWGLDKSVYGADEKAVLKQTGILQPGTFLMTY